jgi:uncharacterized protein (DUF4213/DUF364 family)
VNAVVAETIAMLEEKYPVLLKETSVADLVIGIFFTGVKLSSGHGGVAFTPAAEIPEAVCCPTSAARMPQAGHLDGRPTSELIRYALDRNVLKSAIGIAVLNAVSQSAMESDHRANYSVVKDADGFDILNVRNNDRVALIGAFTPYIRRLREMGNPFFIVEKNPRALKPDEMDLFRPESDLTETLERSDVIIMTGTAIVNHTIDAILTSVSKGKRTAIIGPTASMIPDAFFRRGVDVMAGVRILNADLMIKVLKQGGSAYHLLRQCSGKIAFTRPGSCNSSPQV